MKTKIQISLCLIAIMLFNTSCFNNSRQNSEKQDTESNQPAYEVDTTFLHAYLGGNKVVADEKYKDKRFNVRGMVSEITNVYEPIVKVETEVGPVECVFDKSQLNELAKLSVAQKVEINCVFKGIIMSARFENSKIVE